MLRNLAAMLAILCCSFSAVSAEKAATTKADKKTYNLRRQWRIGERLLLTHRHELEISIENRGRKRSNAMDLRYEIPLTVKKCPKAGQVSIEAKPRRVIADMSVDDQHMDTSKGETLNSRLGKRLLKLTKQTFSGQADAAGGPVKLDSPKKHYAIDQIENVLQSPIAYMPAKPVAIGDKWKITRRTYGGPYHTGSLMPIHETTQCELTAVKKTPAGRVATITLAGTAKAKGLPGGEFLGMNVQGQIRCNLDRRTVEIMFVKMAGQDNQERGKQTVTVTYTVLLVPLAKKTPATAPAKGKPAGPSAPASGGG